MSCRWLSCYNKKKRWFVVGLVVIHFLDNGYVAEEKEELFNKIDEATEKAVKEALKDFMEHQEEAEGKKGFFQKLFGK